MFLMGRWRTCRGWRRRGREEEMGKERGSLDAEVKVEVEIEAGSWTLLWGD